MGNVVKVGMADLKVAKAPDSLITLGLGSCIGLTLYDIENIVDGELDKIIDPLIAAKTAQDLKEGKIEI